MRKNKFAWKLCAGFVLFIIAMGLSGGVISAADTNSTELPINESSMVKNMEFNEDKDIYGISENQSRQTTIYQHTQVTSSDQEGTWHTDVNHGCWFSDHYFDIVVDAKPEDITDLSLTITAYDVDTKGADWCPQGVEVDTVYINDHYLGILTGADESWSTNTFHVDPDWINGATDTSSSGTNTIHIDTDSTGTGCWCVGIGWAELKGKVGFQIDTVTPKDGARNVDWDNPEISVLFTAPYKSQTMNAQTFTLFYWGADGNKVYVDGTVEYTASHTATFKPSGSLKDGVYYVAEVWGKTEAEAAGHSEWIKGPGGVDLERGKTWAFWTMPNLTGKITVVPIQVARGSTLVPLKPAVIRVYATWERRDDVAPKWQVDKIEAKVSLEDENGNAMLSPIQQFIFKRSDVYTAGEKKAAKQSVNFFGWSPPTSWSGSHTIKAIIEPLKQATTPPRTFEGVGNFIVGSKSPTYSYQYRPLKVGTWALPGTPPANFQTFIGASDTYMLSVYPVSRVNSKPGPATDPHLGAFWRPWVPNENKAVLFLFHLWQMTPGVDRMVGIVPKGWLGQGVLGGADFTGLFCEWGHGKVVLICENAHGTILSHEIGHTYGFVDEEEEFTDIDGFRLYAGGMKGQNRAIPEENMLTSMMYYQPDEPGASWIRNPHYDTLVSEIGVRKLSLSASGSQYLLVSGTIDENDNVYLNPWRTQDFAKMSPPSGPYSIEFRDSGGATLSCVDFDPTPPIMGTDGLQYRFFTFPVALPEETAMVLIKHGASILAQVPRSVNAPSLNIVSPTPGATWSGSQTITWTGSDDDGDTLYYDILYSHNGGTDWTVLTMGQIETSHSFDTTKVCPGTSALIKVCASDGFDTTEQVVSITVANPIVINAVCPAPEESEVSIKMSIQIAFNNEMDVSSFTGSTFSLQDDIGNPVTGTFSYDSSSWTATFIPDNELSHETQYTASLTAGVTDIHGNTLVTDYTWFFITETDGSPPLVIKVSPIAGTTNIPLNTLIAATFDKDMDASSINTSTFTLSGGVSGSVTYDAASMTAIFHPSANLQVNTPYTVTLTSGIEDAAGNAMEGDYSWSFTTGSDISAGLRCTGSYADRAVDDDSDGLYDRLLVDVGVEVLSLGTYNLNGKLVDADGEEIEWAATGNLYLNTGVHTLQLVFSGSAIRSQGVDGPYTLTDLHLYDAYNTSLYVWLTDAYSTYAYNVSKFHAVLTLTGLPDTTLAPGESRDNAFNLNDYTHHETLPDSELVYAIDINTDPRCGVSIDVNDYVDINPEPGWVGYSDITIKVTGGSSMAWDTFRITVDGAALPDLTLASEDIQFIPPASSSTSSTAQAEVMGAYSTINSSWTASPPTIDGTLESVEWVDATRINITYHSGGNCSMLVMNDEENLYIAFDVANDTTNDINRQDVVQLGFDGDHDNLIAPYDTDPFYLNGTCVDLWAKLRGNSTESKAGWLNMNETGTNYILWYYSSDPTGPQVLATGFLNHRIYEYSVPLTIALNVSAGDTIGYNVLINDGVGTADPYDFITQGLWPSTWNGLCNFTADGDLTLATATVTEIASLEATIHNIGTADASDVTVQFFDGEPGAGGIQIGDNQTITSIPADGEETVSVDWTSEACAHTIYVQVDPFDSIQESNEENNIAFKIILLGVRGDLNNDGTLTPADSIIALQIAAGSHSFDPVTLAAADVSGDNRVTSLDALMILQAAAGAIEL